MTDWRTTLAGLGIDGHLLDGRHHPCPGCGGRDRFRFDNRDGRGPFICGQGGGEVLAGDGWDLLRHVFGWDWKKAHEHLAIPLSGAERPVVRPPEPPKPKPPSEYALTLWADADRSNPAVASHPYGVRKRITWHAGGGRVLVPVGEIVGGHDCLIWPVRDIATRDVVGAQCIREDGRKQTFGPARGNAVMLGHPHWIGRDWYVVEGVADAVSVFRSFGTVVFAALSTGKQIDHLVERIIEVYAPEHIVKLEDAA